MKKAALYGLSEEELLAMSSEEMAEVLRGKKQEQRKKRILTRAKNWRLANLEKARADERARYAANIEKYRATGRAWYKTNKEKCQATDRDWYKTNREKVLATKAAWREKNHEKILQAGRAKRAANPEKHRAAIRRQRLAKLEYARARDRAWHARNAEKVRAAKNARRAANPEHTRAAARALYAKNPEKHRKATQIWRQTNREKIGTQQREWRKAHPGYAKKHAQENLQYRIATRLRGRLNDALKGKTRSASAVKDLGCTIPELKAYLESLWEPGMNWDNWGRGENDWQIDHILAFWEINVLNTEDLKRVCHYKNLRPLWRVQNQSRPRRKSMTTKAA